MIQSYSSEQLAQAIIRIKNGTASERESILVRRWLEQAPDNHRIYQSIIRGETINKHLNTAQQINSTTDFESLRKQLETKLARKHKRRILLRIATVAAVSAGVALFFMLRGIEEIPSDTVTIAAYTPETTTDSTVVLILESGEKLSLSDTFNISQYGTTRITKIAESDAPRYNMIITPACTDYRFTLPDGTRVVLNAGSCFEFPTQFSDTSRTVRLSGEAYFEVSSDRRRPFTVISRNHAVRVLGTHFNVNAYPDNSDITTTLIEGSVEISLTKESQGTPFKTILTPGMKSAWKQNSEKIEIMAADIESVQAWVNHQFLFKEEKIGNVLHALAQWYHVEFSYKPGTIEFHTITAMISRNERLETILDILTLAGGPRFEITDKKVFVLERD